MIETLEHRTAPWKEVSAPIQPGDDIPNILKVAKLDWEVKKMPMVAYDKNTGGPNIKVDDYYALVRGDTNKVLGICGRVYKPTQNKDAFGFFTRFLGAGNMKMERVGMLDGGRHTWGIAKMEIGFDLPEGDRIGAYLLLSNPHIWGKSMNIVLLPTRLSCMNMLSYAMSTVNSRFRMLHFHEFDQKLKILAEETIGVSKKLMQAFEHKALILANAKVEHAEVQQYILDLFYPGKDVSEVKEKESKKFTFILDAFYNSPGNELRSAKGTWWGALNAVTYFIDHYMGLTQDKRLKDAWFGTTGRLKQKALDIALERATEKD